MQRAGRVNRRVAALLACVCCGQAWAQSEPVDPPGEPSLCDVLDDGFGDIRFDIGALMQFRYIATASPDAAAPDDEETLGFSFRRLRPKFTFDAADGRVRGVFTAESRDGDSGLLDMYAEFGITEELRLRVGRFALGVNREQSVSASKQIAVDRSSLGNQINTNEGDRVKGVELRFTREPDRLTVVLHEGTGVADSAYNSRIAEWGVSLRYERLLIGESFKPFAQHTAPRGTSRGLLLGLGGHAQSLQDRGDRFAFVADLSYQDSGFSAMVMGLGRVAEDRNTMAVGEPESAWGVVSQAGLYVTEDIEPFVRHEFGTTSDADTPDLHLLTVGANYYIVGQLLKVTADASVAFDGVAPAFDRTRDGLLLTPEGADRWVLRLQVQMIF